LTAAEIEVRAYTGKLEADQKEQMLDDFRNDPNKRVIVMFVVWSSEYYINECVMIIF